MRRQWNMTAIALTLMALMMPAVAQAYRYEYETYEGDPMKTLVHTLPNGLKIYMSVNRDQPRIQTNITVRVGSKNDPPETTGLAHYFEHMMFKGTKHFGTSDYAAEKPMLDQIESLFEQYRVSTDSTERAALYHRIDSISYEASKIAIPNEYDKLMSTIGANGTNAYTSYDMTCYVEDIPSNELERWARVEADRFEWPVLRGFHTELETIYEEKNMSLTRDTEKMYDGMMEALFPDHPYGQWTVLGHQQHLKNPSITNIKNYHKQWYVPNNMAIVLAGDFDPDNAVDIISRHFGHLKPNESLPTQAVKAQKAQKADEAVTAPLHKDVWGNESESLLIAWPFGGANDPSLETLDIVDAMLSNGKAGLIDQNINRDQKALGVGAGFWRLADRSVYIILGRPREGQTLDELKALILGEVAKLRDGDFDESLIPATINNYKLQRQRSIESNSGRVNILSDIFVNDLDPQVEFTTLDRQSRLTKQDIVDFARKHLRDDNYVAVYKLQGKDSTELKIAKQPITPIVVNREKSSDYLNAFVAETVEPIEPVFLDFDKDLTVTPLGDGGATLLYKRNDTNDIFKLIYVYDFGTNADKDLAMLQDYFSLLGTPTMDNAKIAQRFYDIACSYWLSVEPDRSYVVITGLSENMDKAVALVEELMREAVPDAEVYSKVAARTLKGRSDDKTSQQGNFSALRRYVKYGHEQLREMVLTDDEITTLDPSTLTRKLAGMNDVEHTVIYYGPLGKDEAVATLDRLHPVSGPRAAAPVNKRFEPIKPAETVFFVAPYDAKQLYMYEYTTDGKTYDPAIEPLRQLYNEYFGGSMNSIVFQEMREARSLAYSAWAYMYAPSKRDREYSFSTQIATQNDKLDNALTAFEEIIEDMPVSDKAFNLAKSGLDAKLRTNRIIKDNVAWKWLSNKDLGIEGDPNKTFYELLPSMTLDDVVGFQRANVKGRHYYVGILGDPADLDLEALRRRGRVVLLTTDEIFGY